MKPLKVEFGPITAENVAQVRKMNDASLPVAYNESLYRNILKGKNGNILNRCAYYKGTLVGAICARLDPSEPRRLYIMTLAVVAAFRGREIGSQLLQNILDGCTKQPAIEEVALHVQVSNIDAIRFYTDRFNFAKGDLIKNYYKRIDHPHCYLLYKKVLATNVRLADDSSSTKGLPNVTLPLDRAASRRQFAPATL
ncbi:hypothetical protein MPSEU_000638300 [Mayamaea pseudoterrestris]|nr:hypothetical protein MPSEU_000638300 [Mayamaea pseudoterrestris]